VTVDPRTVGYGFTLSPAGLGIDANATPEATFFFGLYGDASVAGTTQTYTDPADYIAALDAATGLATAWDPGASDEVYALAVNGPTVYACGEFTGIGGQSRRYIAALDAETALATAWNPDASDIVIALAVDGSTVYAGGAFTRIGGRARNRIAALDAETGLATTWNTSASGEVYALAVSGSMVYAGGDFMSIGGAARHNLAALDAATGLSTPWDPDLYGTVYTLALSGSTIYAGGAFRSSGDLPRAVGIAAFEIPTAVTLESFEATAAVDAVMLSWRTTLEVQHLGFHVYRALDASGPYDRRTETIICGRNPYVFTDVDVRPGRTYYYRLCAVSLDGREVSIGHTAVTIAAQWSTVLHGSRPNPFVGTTEVRFSLARPGHVTLGVFDVRGRLVKQLASGDRRAGEHVLRWDGCDNKGRRVSAGLYLYRLDASGTTYTNRVVRLRDH